MRGGLFIIENKKKSLQLINNSDTESGFDLKKIIIGIAVLILILAGNGLGSAATLTVDQSGSSDYTTITAAINSSAPGDTILVNPGTYNENIDVNKQVLISSAQGAEVTNVAAVSAEDNVFEVTASGVTISGFTITGASDSEAAGIYLSSGNNTITNNTLSGNGYGIRLMSSADNTITGNTANDNDYGIYMYGSEGNTLQNNVMSGNTYNFGIFGYYGVKNEIDTSNTVDGKPVYYLVGVSGITVDSSSNAGTVYCIECQNVTIKDLDMSNTVHGVYFHGTSNSIIDNVKVSNTRDGIALWYYSDGNTVTHNNAANNEYGIALRRNSENNLISNNVVSDTSSTGLQIYADSNIVTDNVVSENNGHGISVTASNVTLDNNTASNNHWMGFYLATANGNSMSGNIANGNGNYGVFLSNSGNNVMDGNTFSENSINGLCFNSSGSNTVTENRVNDNNYYGLEMSSSDDNLIYNNIFNNNENVLLEGNNTGNVWNTEKTEGENILGGAYLGGNYWATPDSTGFSQTHADTNGDGICDAVYSLDSGNVDNLPLSGNVSNVSNLMPVAVIKSVSPNPAVTGEEVSFSGNGTDSDGTVEAYRWESSIDGELSDAADFNTSNLSAGTHTIGFTVQDNGGAWSDPAYSTLVINNNSDNSSNQMPVANIVSVSPNPADIDETVFFEGNGTDADGTVEGYKWDSSIDGELSTAASFNSSSLSEGSHTISFAVLDNNGSWSEAVSMVLVVNDSSSAFVPLLEKVTPEDGSSLSSGTTEVTVMFNYSDPQDDINNSSIVFTFAGKDVTDDNATTITDSYAMYNATGLSAGTYSASLYVADSGNNSSTFTTSFTIEKKKSSSSGGSSGGGGSGGSTGEKYTNIAVKDVQTVYINKDSHVSYEFSKEGNAISSVQFDSLKNSGKIQTIVEVLKSRSTFADSDAPGNVYQQMNIWVGKSGFTSSDNIENPVIDFKVEKSWLEQNSIEKDSVKLYRYADDKWNSLETSVADEDPQYVYYESKTSGFSPFAISADVNEEKSVQETAAVKETEPEEDENLMSVTDDSAEDNQTQTQAGSAISTSSILVMLGVIAVVLVGGTVLYRRKR